METHRVVHDLRELSYEDIEPHPQPHHDGSGAGAKSPAQMFLAIVSLGFLFGFLLWRR